MTRYREAAKYIEARMDRGHDVEGINLALQSMRLSPDEIRRAWSQSQYADQDDDDD